MKEIKEIIEWNKIANNNNFNYHLANSMLSEELSETIIAMKNKDYIEMLDGILDIFFIGIGELYKVGFTEEQIQIALDRIIKNNYSKFIYKDGKYICQKDNNGKIIKPEGFKKVDLSDLKPKK